MSATSHHYPAQLKLALKKLRVAHLFKSELLRIAKGHMEVRFEVNEGSSMRLSIGSVIMVGPAESNVGVFFSGKVQDLNVAGKGYWKAKISYEHVYKRAGGDGVNGLYFRGGRLTECEFPDFSDKANVVHAVEDVNPRDLSSGEQDRLMELFIGFCDKFRKKT